MATTTPRIGLTKPDGTDLVDIAVLNTNFDKIDSNIASTKIQSTKPTTANAGDLWWDSDTGTLYLYYVDANSSQWVAATSDPINIGVVASQAERDAQYPTPAQGMSVYRTDLGVTQRYYGLFNSSTNPGGRNTAGWYDTEKSVGLVPISPSSVVVTTGTATANSMGQVSFTGASSVSLNNVFSNKFRNYRIVLTHENATQTGGMFFKYRTAGTDNSAANGYLQTGLIARQNATQSYFNFTSTVHVLYDWVATAQWSHAILDIFRPYATAKTEISGKAFGYSSSSISSYTYDGIFDSGNPSFDGFSLHPSTGLVDGTVQVFGYND